MTEVNEFTIDIGRGYQVTGRASVDGDLFDIVLQRADGQPFGNGQAEFALTLSIDHDLDAGKKEATVIVTDPPGADQTGEADDGDQWPDGPDSM